MNTVNSSNLCALPLPFPPRSATVFASSIAAKTLRKKYPLISTGFRGPPQIALTGSPSLGHPLSLSVIDPRATNENNLVRVYPVVLQTVPLRDLACVDAGYSISPTRRPETIPIS